MNKNKHVVWGGLAIIITHAADRTGAPQIICNVARHLNERFGIKCITFSLQSGPLLADFKKLGEAWVVENNTIKEKGIQVNSYIESLKVKPGFALINTACCGSTMGEINKCKIPAITFIHDFTYIFDNQYLQNLYHLSDHIVYPVQFMIEQNFMDYPFDLAKTSVIPQGLYKAEMLDADYESLRIKFRNKYNVPDDAFVILGNGFIHPRKGIDIFINTAIQVLSDLNHNIPVYFFWLGGELNHNSSDEYVRFLSRDITNTNNSEYIRFVGEVKDVLPYYAMADLFFLSSREDPFPTVVLEAFAAALPVIGIEGCSGSIEIIKNTGNFSVPYNKRGELAKELIKLIYDRPLLSDAGKSGRKLVFEDYNFEDYVDKIVDLIESKIDFSPGNRPVLIKVSIGNRLFNFWKKFLKKILSKPMPWTRITYAEAINSFIEKMFSFWKKGQSRSDWHQSVWKKLLPDEKAYWERWLEDKSNKSFMFRLDPKSKIQDWLAVYLNTELKVNRILDVGSGPLSNIGKQCEFCDLEIVCCDVLADEYRELLLNHEIKPPFEIRKAEGERLTSVFPENEFDIVFSNNAVDHTYDAIKTIHEMIKTAKVGGFVVIQVSEKEGQRNLYRGLHQWDCYVKDSRFLIKRRYMDEVDVGDKFKLLAEVTELSYVYENPAGLPWDHQHIRFVLKKTTNRTIN